MAASTATFHIGTRTGLIDQKHRQALGPATWLFQYLVARQTDKEGRVLYGHTITYKSISAETNGMPARTLCRWMARLRKAGYVQPNPSGFGLQPVILNQKKFVEGKPNGKRQPEPVRRESRQGGNDSQADRVARLLENFQRDA